MSERPKAVRERIPRRWGIIPLGSKLGDPILPVPEGQQQQVFTVSGFTDSHADYYATKIEVTGPDTIRVYDESPGGFTNEMFFKGSEINQSPAKGKLHWG